MSSMTKAAGVLVFQACCKRILSLHCTDNVLFSEIFESSRCCLSLLVLSQDPEEKKTLAAILHPKPEATASHSTQSQRHSGTEESS